MGKDKEKYDKKARKELKEKKREQKISNDGVTKPKKEKKEKKKSKDAAVVEALLQEQLEQELQHQQEKAATTTVVVHPAAPKQNGTAVALVGALVPFANPLADEKQTKAVLKGIKKATKAKTLKRGVKEVVKALRKSQTTAPSSSAVANPLGVVILAADISPMDVISHIPVLCEDHNIPYIYVRSRAELGAASSTKRPTSVVMVSKDREKAKDKVPEEDKKEFDESYKGLVELVKKAAETVKV